MPFPPDKLSRRVASLLHQRERLRAQAPGFALRYYREHRRLPPGYVLTLLSKAAVRRIRLRGEIEHITGIAWLYSLRPMHGSAPSSRGKTFDLFHRSGTRLDSAANMPYLWQEWSKRK
jgi:hypothetical protein